MTSTNALAFLKRVLKLLIKPQTRLYCIEGNTSRACRKLGIKRVLAASTAASIGNLIVENNETNALHLTCPDRKFELQSILENAGIVYWPVEVYEKEKQQIKVSDFDAVAFFSPSQVEAFFESGNIISKSVQIFCIGETTASAIPSTFKGQVHIAENHSIKSVIKCAVKFYKHES
jgi:uroporphyrinogen-III synthase